MWGVIAFLCGFGCGGITIGMLAWIARSTRDPMPRPQLPPATSRAIARVRRRNRADLRVALARAGIKLHEPFPSANDKRRWIPLSEANFNDHEETK